MISRNHPNRRAYNWLIYDVGDRFLQKYIPLYRGVLYDLGAGESPYRDFFLQHAERYVAVEWGGSLHDTRPDVTADLNRTLPVADGAADTVVSLSVLEHLHAPQVMLGEAFRILKPGGAIILEVPWQWWIHEAPHDHFRYSPYGLRHLLEQAGFVDIEVEAQAGFFTMLVLKLNYFSLRMIRGPAASRMGARLLLWPFWQAGQLAAPWLDRLDRHPELEAPGYFVTARKPGARA
jgi:SAM-dependent methyltransferase